MVKHTIKDVCYYCQSESYKYIFNVTVVMVENKQKTFVVVNCLICGSFYRREVEYV
jgi:RNase P subunit RPR2